MKRLPVLIALAVILISLIGGFLYIREKFMPVAEVDYITLHPCCLPLEGVGCEYTFYPKIGLPWPSEPYRGKNAHIILGRGEGENEDIMVITAITLTAESESSGRALNCSLLGWITNWSQYYNPDQYVPPPIYIPPSTGGIAKLECMPLDYEDIHKEWEINITYARGNYPSPLTTPDPEDFSTVKGTLSPDCE